MIGFSCPACSTKLRVEDSKAAKLISCPNCGEKITLGPEFKPMVFRELETKPKLIGFERSWTEAEFEESRSPKPDNAGESFSTVPQDDFVPSLLDDSYEWERDRQRRNRNALLSVGLLGVCIAIVLGLLVINNRPKNANAKPDDPKNEATSGRSADTSRDKEPPTPPPDLPKLIPDTRKREEGEIERIARERLERRVPQAPEKPEDKRPKITQEEIEKDQQSILQYVKVLVKPKGNIREQEWKGPWLAQKGDDKGKLYRLHALANYLDENLRHKDNYFELYLFLCDGRVLNHQNGRVDLDKLTICKPIDPKPLVPEDQVAGANLPRKPKKRMERWNMIFKTKNGSDYLLQLHSIGAILVIPGPQDTYTVYRNLGKAPFTGKKEDIEAIKGLRWMDTNKASVNAIAAVMGLPNGLPHMIVFFPESFEDALRKKERAAYDGPEEDIEETSFRIEPRGGRFEAVVLNCRHH